MENSVNNTVKDNYILNGEILMIKQMQRRINNINQVKNDILKRQNDIKYININEYMKIRKNLVTS